MDQNAVLIFRPTITVRAERVAEVLGIGIERAAVYGNHTGAAIAVEFAANIWPIVVGSTPYSSSWDCL